MRVICSWCRAEGKSAPIGEKEPLNDSRETYGICEHHRARAATPSKAVVRYANGTVLKGYTYDFDPNKPVFHVAPAEHPLSDESLEVWIKDLKAVFFVRDFAGNPEHQERKDDLVDKPPPASRKVRVEFTDGEVLVGYSMGYDPRRQGFFFTPVDRESNNLRIFAVIATVRRVGQA